MIGAAPRGDYPSSIAVDADRLTRFREEFFAAVPRFRYLATVGRGGMGVVYKAEDLELGETIALKVLFSGAETKVPDLLTRFKREVSLTRRIKHPNVTRIFELGTGGDFPFITMEFVPGRTLLAWLRELGPFHPAFAVSVLRQVCLGVEAAHRLGIIHRDLKSANVMVDAEGHASVLDFGLARLGPSGDLTGTHLVGTPEYMAPEQARGKGSDFLSDVYSIGVIAFEILTGSLPFAGGPPVIAAMRHVHEPLPNTLAEAGIPAPLEALVRSILAKDPAERPQGAGALAEALSKLPGGDGPVRPRGVGFPANAPETAAPATVPSPRRASRTAERAPATVERRRRPMVLIADPDAAERRPLAAAFEATGCETHMAEDGAAALEAVRDQKTDLAVLAVGLPKLDGFDVARILKSDPKTAAIPIVLVTARLQKPQLAFAQQVGAAELVARPPAPAALAAKGWRHLKRAGFQTKDEIDTAKKKGRAALEGKKPAP